MASKEVRLHKQHEAEQGGLIASEFLSCFPPDMDERHRQACFLVGMGNTHANTALVLGYEFREAITKIVRENRALVQTISNRKNTVLTEVFKSGAYQCAENVCSTLTKLGIGLREEGKGKWTTNDALNMAKTGEVLLRLCRELDEMSKGSAPPSQTPNTKDVMASIKELNALPMPDDKPPPKADKP